MSVLLTGGPVQVRDLHRVAAGAPVRACPHALSRMVGAEPPGGSVLARKRAWLLGQHAMDLPDEDLPRAFLIDHAAGVGEPFDPGLVRAMIAARANTLLAGRSGCRPVVVEALLAMLDLPELPAVPSQGSVGAAGDLAPMAHIARVLCQIDGPVPGLPPFSPSPKEALALINGVSVTAALAAVAVRRAERVADAAVCALAMTLEALGADAGLLDPRPLVARGHVGGVQVGARLQALLAGSRQVRAGRPPDAFSLRCAPQVLGAALDALGHVRGVVEAELGGVSDNPLVFEGPDGDDWVESGNFHGAALGLAMDHLKIALAHIATASERRTFRLTCGELTGGLPSFLVPGTGLNSGFMIAQYTAASLASEVKGLAHPASVDSIPTVQHHEDHVSMGPIAARMALEALECVADIVAIEALLAAQALDLRLAGHGPDGVGAPVPIAPEVLRLRAAVRAVVPAWWDDGVMHPCLKAAGALVRAGGLGDADPTPW